VCHSKYYTSLYNIGYTTGRANTRYRMVYIYIERQRNNNVQTMISIPNIMNLHFCSIPIINYTDEGIKCKNLFRAANDSVFATICLYNIIVNRSSDHSP